MHDLSRRQPLDRLSHPGAPTSSFFSLWLFNFCGCLSQVFPVLKAVACLYLIHEPTKTSEDVQLTFVISGSNYPHKLIYPRVHREESFEEHFISGSFE